MFWQPLDPFSRERRPKPFLPLPTTGQSLIQEAYLRAAALPQTREILTVTNRELYFQALDAYKSARIWFFLSVMDGLVDEVGVKFVHFADIVWTKNGRNADKK